MAMYPQELIEAVFTYCPKCGKELTDLRGPWGKTCTEDGDIVIVRMERVYDGLTMSEEVVITTCFVIKKETLEKVKEGA